MKGKSSGPDCGLSCHVSVRDMRAGPGGRDEGTSAEGREAGSRA